MMVVVRIAVPVSVDGVEELAQLCHLLIVPLVHLPELGEARGGDHTSGRVGDACSDGAKDAQLLGNHLER